MNDDKALRKQLLITSGIVDAYQYALRKLCENGLPVKGYFEACANYILEYNLIQQGMHKPSNLRIREQDTIEPSENLINFQNSPSSKKIHPRNSSKNKDNSFKYKISLSNYEKIIPVICKQNTEIELSIFGKWLIVDSNSSSAYNYEDNNCEKTSNGDPANDIGCILYRIYPQMVKFEKLNKNTQVKLEKDSILFIKCNINENSKMKFSGKPILHIKNVAKAQSRLSLLGLFGFDQVFSQVPNLLNYINMARRMPKKFADIFLKHRIKESDNVKAVYEMMKNMKPLKNIEHLKTLDKFANELGEDLVKKNQFSFTDRNGKIANKRKIGNVEKVKECVILMKDGFDMIDVVVKMIIDEMIPNHRNRKAIFGESFDFFGFSFLKHSVYENIVICEFSE